MLPSLVSLGRTHIINDSSSGRFHVLNQLGHKQLVRLALKSSVDRVALLNAQFKQAPPNLCWYSPKGALANAESARTDATEMRSALGFLRNHLLTEQGEVIITTTKYFSSSELDSFLEEKSKQFHVYHTIGHRIYSTIALPTIVHSLRATHREDVMMKTVANFVCDVIASSPEKVTSSFASSILWGKQSLDESFELRSEPPSSDNADASKLLCALLAAEPSLSKTKQKLKARRSFAEEKAIEAKMLADINATRGTASTPSLHQKASKPHGNNTVKFQSEYDLGDHATNDDSANAPPVNHFKEHLKRPKSQIQSHFDDCGDDISGIPDDLIQANLAVTKFAAFVGFDDSTDAGSCSSEETLDSDHEYDSLFFERDFTEPAAAFAYLSSQPARREGTDVFELFGGEGGVLKASVRRGLKAGANFDLTTSFDLHNPSHIQVVLLCSDEETTLCCDGPALQGFWPVVILQPSSQFCILETGI